jgi:hypothetical protein
MADNPTSATSSENVANQSTRQLLDELDALMQRMLALPVQPSDDEPGPQPVAPPTPPAAADPAPVASRTLTVQAQISPLPATQELVVTRTAAPVVKAPAVQPPPRRIDLEPPDMTAPTYVPLGAEPLLPLILQRPRKPGLEVLAPKSPAPAPPKPATAPQLAPPPSPPLPTPHAPAWGSGWVHALNRRYDRATDWLGPLGRWLRGRQGRNLLGWLGLVMLAAAVGWALVQFLG